jgi:hypothetical protein
MRQGDPRARSQARLSLEESRSKLGCVGLKPLLTIQCVVSSRIAILGGTSYNDMFEAQ